MADQACLNDSAGLLGNTTISAVVLEGAVLVSDSTYSFDVTPYLNLKSLLEETGVSDTTTSVTCSGGGSGVSDTTTSVTCSGGGSSFFEEYNYEANSITEPQLDTWQGMTPEQKTLVSPTYYIDLDGNIIEVT
jgi:hypothetical protein